MDIYSPSLTVTESKPQLLIGPAADAYFKYLRGGKLYLPKPVPVSERGQ